MTNFGCVPVAHLVPVLNRPALSTNVAYSIAQRDLPYATL